MNPLLGLIGGANGNKAILMQAVGAMMRGEPAESFMQNLAKTNPQLQGLDLTNLEQTTHKLSQKKGIDEAQLTNQIKAEIGKM